MNGSSVVDVEKMAVDLQAQHREYSRKKRAVFQQLVGEVYRDYKTELGVTDEVLSLIYEAYTASCLCVDRQ